MRAGEGGVGLAALGASRCCPAPRSWGPDWPERGPALEGSKAAPPPHWLRLGGGSRGGVRARQACPVCKSWRLRPPPPPPPLAAPEVSRKETAALQPVGRRGEPERRVTGAEERRGLWQGPAGDCR